MRKKQIFFIGLGVAILVSVITSFYVINGHYQNRKLFDAVKDNDYFAAQQAIEKGAFVNERRHWLYWPELLQTNDTPLIIACNNGNEEMIKLLLENGADINKNDNFTKATPLLSVLNSGEQNRFELAKYLIANGADIHASQRRSSPFNYTLYYYEDDSEQTIQQGFELFKFLMENQVDIDIKSSKQNALTFSAQHRNYNTVRYFIENGYFDVNDYDEAGDTALIVAAKNERESMVELLLELGADVALKDSEGKTALDYAKEKNNTEIIELLTR